MQQVRDNTGYMDEFVPLTQEEQTACLQAAEIIRSNIAVPCTGCRYCIPVCPKQIAIPDYFHIFNQWSRTTGGKGDLKANYYNPLTQKFGSPEDCIKCGACEQRCPQHLTIRTYLEQVAEAAAAL